MNREEYMATVNEPLCYPYAPELSLHEKLAELDEARDALLGAKVLIHRARDIMVGYLDDESWDDLWDTTKNMDGRIDSRLRDIKRQRDRIEGVGP